jgi:tRNA (guanine-N7-)-methyltransferase
MEDSTAGLNDPLSVRDTGIRSYVVRSGRMTVMQQHALTQLYPCYGIRWNPELKLQPEILFGKKAPFIVEIGFGMGSATATIAEALPETVFLGLEVHAPGVGKLLSEIETRHIKNLRVCRHDATEVVGSMLEAESVDGFHIFFPDPWPKKRHHKRRIMNADFIHLLATRLKHGSYLYYVTDWEEYAEATLDLLDAEPLLKNEYERWADREPWRPATKFEKRALDDGRPIRELKFTRK